MFLSRLDARTSRCDVEERPQRTRRRQRVAGSHEHPSFPVEPVAPRTHERGLAGAGLTMDEREPTAAGVHLVVQPRQGLQQVGPLHECHRLRIGSAVVPDVEGARRLPFADQRGNGVGLAGSVVGTFASSAF